MPTLLQILKNLPDIRNNPYIPEPDERDMKAARLLLDGRSIQSALIEAGFPESTASHGKAAITGSIVKALRKCGLNHSHIGQVFRSDVEGVKDAIFGWLYTAMEARNSKGVNAAKLLGSIREIDMFAKPEITQNNVIINAPPDFNPMPKEAKPREAPKALPPAEAPDVDYE